jgi:hypothetical protein
MFPISRSQGYRESDCQEEILSEMLGLSGMFVPSEVLEMSGM